VRSTDVLCGKALLIEKRPQLSLLDKYCDSRQYLAVMRSANVRVANNLPGNLPEPAI
jgi:hypothetical protein